MFKRLTLFALIVILSACQTVPKIDETTTNNDWLSNARVFKQAYKDFDALTQWQYSAKVGIVTPNERAQANMVWSFEGQGSNTIRLFGPLGIGAVKIQFDEQNVVLSDRKGELHRGDNAQQLLESIVGWPIPVDALQYWLFSLPLPNQQYVYRLDGDNHIAALKQLGWTIHYSNYRNYFDGRWPLARKMIATKQVNPEQTLKVTLITRSWK